MKVYTVTGCIAVGKSTLAKCLSEVRQFQLISEECDENPYLADYYKDMKEFAFKMQLWYLNNRISQLIQCRNKEVIVQDQMLQAFGYIFPTLQRKNGFMNGGEFRSMMSVLNMFYDRKWEAFPDGMDETIFYLRVKEEDVGRILDRIKEERKRECEVNIPEDYLRALIAEYEEWHQRTTKTHDRIVTLDAFAPIDENLSKALESVQ